MCTIRINCPGAVPCRSGASPSCDDAWAREAAIDSEPGPPARPVGPYEKSLRAAAADSTARPSPAQAAADRLGAGRSGGRHRAPPSAGPSRKIKLVAFVLVPLLLLTFGAYLIFRPDGGPVRRCVRRDVLDVPRHLHSRILTKAAAAFDGRRLVGRWAVHHDDRRLSGAQCLRGHATRITGSQWGEHADGVGADAEHLARGLGQRPELSTALPRTFPVVAVRPAVVAAPRSWPRRWAEARGTAQLGRLDQSRQIPKGWERQGASRVGKGAHSLAGPAS